MFSTITLDEFDQMLEDELGNNAVDEIQSKLEKVEGKLEETETYCYQVVEENVELKAEIEKYLGEDLGIKYKPSRILGLIVP